MIYALVLAATLIENVIAVTNAAAQIDAAIVAKGGTTAGGLTNAPAAIAALPTGGGSGWVKPADWPDLYKLLAEDTTTAYAKIAVYAYPNISLPVYNTYPSMDGYRTSSGYVAVGKAGMQNVDTGTGGWGIFYYNSSVVSSGMAYRGLNERAECYQLLRMAVVEGNLFVLIRGDALQYIDFGPYLSTPSSSADEFRSVFMGSGSRAYKYVVPITSLTINNAYFTFGENMNVEELPIGSIISTGSNANFSYLFNRCFSLVRAPGTLDLSKCSNINSIFNECYALREIPTNITLNAGLSLSFYHSPMIEPSSIATFDQNGNINGGMVYNLNSNEGSSGTITFNSAVKPRFTSDQQTKVSNMITSKGWVLSW